MPAWTFETENAAVETPNLVYTVTGDADDMEGWTSESLYYAVRAALEPLGIRVEHRPHQLGEGGLDGDDWQEVERMRMEIEPILTEVIYAGPTLRDLFDTDPGSAAYSAARRAKVAEIAEHIRDHLRDPSSAGAEAEALMTRAEERGHIDGNAVSGEIPGRRTRSGNPLPVEI